jgi:hypothetical protein
MEPKAGDVIITVPSSAPSLATGEVVGWPGTQLDTKSQVVQWAERIVRETKGQVFIRDQASRKTTLLAATQMLNEKSLR